MLPSKRVHKLQLALLTVTWRVAHVFFSNNRLLNFTSADKLINSRRRHESHYPESEEKFLAFLSRKRYRIELGKFMFTKRCITVESFCSSSWSRLWYRALRLQNLSKPEQAAKLSSDAVSLRH